VEVMGCCDIHDNDVGILVEDYYVVEPEPGQIPGYLVANGNDIYDNRYWGVYLEEYLEEEPGLDGGWVDCELNWWGDEEGPLPPAIIGTDPGFGNPVTYGVDYTPWLDGPCPNGNPVGMNARLSGAARSGEPGLTVQFRDLSTPAPGCHIVSWEWDFGDGEMSTDENPSHTYYREGVYTVTLCVEDSCGFSDCVTMRAYIVVEEKNQAKKAEEAKMAVSYLFVDPVQVLPNQEVTVSANVCNQGGERGTKTAVLSVNGHAEQSQSVGVSGGACQQVTFRVSRAVPGTYQVSVDGMVGQFTVLAPRTVTQNVPSQQDTGIPTIGIVLIIIVALVLIFGLVLIFRA
jgi:PKD repeat protein